MVWYSDSKTDPALLPLGNGRLLAWEQGAALFSLRMGYSSPHLCALVPEFDNSYHEIITERFPNGDGAVLRLYYSSHTLETPSRAFCDLLVTDQMVEDQPIFLRRLDGLSELTWKLVLPSYVRCVYHAGYRFGKRRADTIFLTIPAGTPMESGLATTKEQTAAILLSGAFEYNSSTGKLHYGGDFAELAVLCYEDPKELVREGDRILDAFSASVASPDPHPLREGLPDSDEAPSLSERLLQTIHALIAEDGVVLTSHREPYAVASDLPALIEVLLQIGERETARRILLRFQTQLSHADCPPSRLLSGDGRMPESGLTDYSALAAHLLAAVRYLRACAQTGAEKETALLARSVRREFVLLMQGMREGMLPFGPLDRAFDGGLMGRELLFQGSAETTALAIAAGKAYLDYCTVNGKRIAREEAGYREILTQAEMRYEANFTVRGEFVRNAPRLEALTRRPRFIRGICVLCQQEGAYPFEDALELDKYGRYLCRRCFAAHRNAPEIHDPGQRFSSPRATAMAALVTQTPAALRGLSQFALSCAKRLREGKQALPLREGDTDPLVLLALCRRRQAIIALLEREEHILNGLVSEAVSCGFRVPSEKQSTASVLVDFLIDATAAHLERLAADGSLPVLLCDTDPLGGRSAAGATALCCLALREARK